MVSETPSSASTLPLGEVRLNRPRDWVPWSRQFEYMAADLWPQIQGTTPWIEKPRTQPFAATFRTPESAEYPEGSANAIRATAAAKLASDILAGEAFFSTDVDREVGRETLTKAQESSLQTAETQYDKNLKVYKEEQNLHVALQRWVSLTVNSDYMHSSCPPRQTLTVWYRNLQAQTEMGQQDHENKIADAYHAHFDKLITGTDFKGDMKWLSTWETLMGKIESEKVEGLYTPAAWLHRFVRKVGKAYPTWAMGYEATVKEKRDKGTLNFREVGIAVLEAMEIAESTNCRDKQAHVRGNANSVRLGKANNQDRIPGDGRSGKSKKGNKGKGGAGGGRSKRKDRSDDSDSETDHTKPFKSESCPLCEKEGHTADKCWSDKPEKAPAWFKAKKASLEKVEANRKAEKPPSSKKVKFD